LRDVKAYISFIKDTVGINHEEELIRAIEILANKVHPLALGNVERFMSQSRMIASKLLTHHTDQNDHHKLEAIIEALTSKLYFHGHPINRAEARELGLKVLPNTPPELETAMWDLYVDFENEMKFRENFDPIGRLISLKGNAIGAPGLFTPLATFDEDISAAAVESYQLSSQLLQKVRYTLTSDPQLQSQMGATVLDLKWNQTQSSPPPARP
jgi:hypothetical protein